MKVDPPVYVSVGDILGYSIPSSSSARLSQLKSTADGQDYDGLSKATGGRHLLHALISTATISTLYLPPPHTVGYIQVVDTKVILHASACHSFICWGYSWHFRM